MIVASTKPNPESIFFTKENYIVEGFQYFCFIFVYLSLFIPEEYKHCTKPRKTPLIRDLN